MHEEPRGGVAASVLLAALGITEHRTDGELASAYAGAMRLAEALDDIRLLRIATGRLASALTKSK